jgi:N-formylglutamate deformylase
VTADNRDVSLSSSKDENEIYALECGDSPLVISAPHVGTLLPDEIAARLLPPGRALVDTDWYADRLYPFAKELGATVLRACWSRYVVDVNRDPAGVSLYPGARTTGLVPVETFEGEPLYAAGDEPNEREIAARREHYFEPYHDALQGEIARLRHKHRYAVVIDAHSIWSPLPLLFDGELPDVNVGTNSGRSCDPDLRDAVVAALSASPYSHVVDGRFKGGYITRRYGNPAHSVHAIQLEINQKTYLADGSRAEWDDAKAARLSGVLRKACEAVLKLAGSRAPSSSTIV